MAGLDHAIALRALENGLQSLRVGGTVTEHPLSGELMAYGVSTFVRGSTIEQANRVGVPLVAHVLSAEASSQSLMLDPGMMAEAARLQDLHLLVLAYRQYSFNPNDAVVLEVMQAGHASFRLMHEGYPLRSVWQEGEPSDHEWMSAGGFRLKRTYERDGRPWRLLFGTLREEVTAEWPGHTVSFLFQSREARLRLTPAQRRVAELALWGLNDEQVAQRLAISGETVRRHWRGVFERIEDRYPKLLVDAPRADGDVGRGPEKRTRVLEFLRINLQEIRATA